MAAANRAMIQLLIALVFFSPISVEAFIARRIQTQSPFSRQSSIKTCNVSSDSVTALCLARKYVVIGGNIEGINPNKDNEEDTYNMSKKERRRRERERAAANFKSGNYKKKTAKDKMKNIDFDKLEEKVS